MAGWVGREMVGASVKVIEFKEKTSVSLLPLEGTVLEDVWTLSVSLQPQSFDSLLPVHIKWTHQKVVVC